MIWQSRKLGRRACVLLLRDRLFWHRRAAWYQVYFQMEDVGVLSGRVIEKQMGWMGCGGCSMQRVQYSRFEKEKTKRRQR